MLKVREVKYLSRIGYSRSQKWPMTSSLIDSGELVLEGVETGLIRRLRPTAAQSCENRLELASLGKISQTIRSSGAPNSVEF